jgi:hypothetical protein
MSPGETVVGPSNFASSLLRARERARGRHARLSRDGASRRCPMIIMKMAKPAKMRNGSSLATLAPVRELGARILEMLSIDLSTRSGHRSLARRDWSSLDPPTRCCRRAVFQAVANDLPTNQ